MLIFAGMIVFAFPGRHPRDHAARAGARLRLAVLHPAEGRRRAAVAAPVLVLRPPGGLHHLPARRRHGVDDRSDDGAHAAGRLPADRRRADRHRLLLLRPVGASHVHHRHSGALAQLLLGRQHGGGAAERHPGLRLDRDHRGGPAAPRDALAVRARLPVHLHARRPHRRDGRDGAVRLAGARHLLRGRAFPLRAGRRHGVSAVRRLLLLGAGLQPPRAVGASRQADVLR